MSRMVVNKVIIMVLFLLFKQKTAYELRISDWSSDVCSSDLPIRQGDFQIEHTAVERLARDSGFFDQPENPRFLDTARLDIGPHRGPAQAGEGVGHQPIAFAAGLPVGRSEEHTSELQSLMRISYAVFCLKNKRNHDNKQTNTANNEIETRH